MFDSDGWREFWWVFWVLVIAAALFVGLPHYINYLNKPPYCSSGYTSKEVLDPSTIVTSRDGASYGKYERICVGNGRYRRLK